jgi:hypothetical protein
MKTCSKESTCRRSFVSWCIVYIRSSSNEGEQETNDEAHDESVVLKVCTSHLKISGRAGYVFEEAETPHQMIFQELEGSRALHNARRKITPCDDCDHILIRRRNSNFELV